jgi:multiple sugar transport system ATP-binding protein
VRVRIVSNQWLGDQSHIAGESGGKLLIAVTPSRVTARPGDSFQFALDPRHLHIFGADGTCIRHAEVS